MQSPSLQLYNGDSDRDSTVPATGDAVIPALEGYADTGTLDWFSALLLGEFVTRDTEGFSEKETGLLHVISDLFGGYDPRGSVHRLMQHRDTVQFAREVHTKEDQDQRMAS